MEDWKGGRVEDTSATFFPSGFLANGRLEGWKTGRRIPILPSCHYTYKPIHIQWKIERMEDVSLILPSCHYTYKPIHI